MANKRTKVLASNVHIKQEDPAGSIQAAIDAIESKGNYVMQYIPVSGFAGVILAHDYPDKKNADDPKDKPAEADAEPVITSNPAPEAPAGEEPEPAAVETPVTREEPAKREPLVESAIDMAKSKNKKGKR